MPVYEYCCHKCANEFEARKSWADDTQSPCPKCGAVVQKKFAVPTVVYKGSGFYTTDYTSRRSTDSSSSSTKPKKDSAKSETSSGSSKPKTASDKATT